MPTWINKKFDELTAKELYAIMQLRNMVFVVEQQCIYQDADDKDLKCYHLMGWLDDDLVAYTRIVPPGISYKEPSIGRVVIVPGKRGTGLGVELMKRSIEETEKHFGLIPIRIGAQEYLREFYTRLGFSPDNDPYTEDGIPHIEMLRSPAHK